MKLLVLLGLRRDPVAGSIEGWRRGLLLSVFGALTVALIWWWH